ncbi:hypothetical protein M3Y98_00701000 [Aphelenchoides besseyi]|nr:hypothetical protein M3Y98_00701000 [Aphelenchoides besseyi]
MTIGDSVGEMFKDESLDKSGVQIDQSSADDPLVSGEEYRQIEGELNDQILNLTTESYVVGERSTVEGEETNEATTDDMEVFLQEFVYSAFTSFE